MRRLLPRCPLDPFDLPATHNFKVGADGQIDEIEATDFRAAYLPPVGSRPVFALAVISHI